MKKTLILLVFFTLCFRLLSGQATETNRLFIPLMDKESQSNVIVSVCNFKGELCSPELTNSLSNTNLFTAKERNEITNAFAKYINVTPQKGPEGTVLIASYETNYLFKKYNLNVNVKETVSIFQYTNQNAKETISFNAGLRAQYRDASNNGYDIGFSQTGGGTMVIFGQVKKDKPDGIVVTFEDMRPQGLTWSYKNADFNDMRLGDYKQYSNGLVLGKCLMWNVIYGKLLIKAEFPTPYDWEKNMIIPKLQSQDASSFPITNQNSHQ